jgi:hypothetical protein
MFEMNNFDAIRIGLASPEKNQGMVEGRGKKAGNDQLQDIETGEGRPLLREDIRTAEGLGMSLRQI